MKFWVTIHKFVAAKEDDRDDTKVYIRTTGKEYDKIIGSGDLIVVREAGSGSRDGIVNFGRVFGDFISDDSIVSDKKYYKGFFNTKSLCGICRISDKVLVSQKKLDSIIREKFNKGVFPTVPGGIYEISGDEFKAIFDYWLYKEQDEKDNIR